MLFFRHMFHSTKSTDFSWIYYFLIIGKMYYGRMKWLHRLDLAREPLCKEPWYRLKSGDSTRHFRNLTPKLNGCDNLRRHEHNFLSRNTVTWRPARGTSQHRTLLTPTELFARNPAIYYPFFSEVDKTCLYFFGMLLRFLENLLEWKFVL